MQNYRPTEPIFVGLIFLSIIMTLFRHFKNELFSRNFGQNMPKNAYFLEKSCKIAAAPGGSVFELPLASGSWKLRPQTPRSYFHLLIQIVEVRF